VAGEVDEERAVLSEEDAREHLQQVSALVTASGADLGAIVDSTGERLRLVDGRGRPVGLREALMAYVELVSRLNPSPRVAVPVTTSRVIEEQVGDRGGEVLWTRIGPKLEEVVDGLPPMHVERVDVATPWESKGAVMRRLVERVNGERTVTIDGVKAFRGRDWALVVPHPKEPLVRVWAEADRPEDARDLAREFAAMVEELRG
jgi:mannose-1-phosphate guanylyltransferase/phosphomannomutase